MKSEKIVPGQEAIANVFIFSTFLHSHKVFSEESICHSPCCPQILVLAMYIFAQFPHWKDPEYSLVCGPESFFWVLGTFSSSSYLYAFPCILLSLNSREY